MAIEFYDHMPIKNVFSFLITVPDKTIFIGDDKIMKNSILYIALF